MMPRTKQFVLNHAPLLTTIGVFVGAYFIGSLK